MKKKFSYIIMVILNLIAACSFAQTQPWDVTSEWKAKINPVAATGASIEAGKKTYLTFCSPCHGEKGKGNGILSVSLNPKPANHTSAKFQQQTNGELFYKIITGRNAMPSYKQTFTEEEIWNIINFIRTLEVKNISKK